MERAVILSVPDDDADGRRRVTAGDAAGANIVEIRADRLGRDEVLRAIGGSPVPVLVTARSVADGGTWDRGEDERLRLYRAALDAGAFAVDVELRSELRAKIGERGLDPSRVVLSHHGGPCTIAILRDRYRELAAVPGVRRKLVPRAVAVDDVLAIREVLRDASADGIALTCFGLGTAGRISRILAPSWGSWSTYGSLGPGRETADGQMTVSDLIEVHDVLGIGARTELFGLLGADIAGSPSPAMHAMAYRALRLDARYLPVETDDLGRFERLRMRLPFEAVGVTAPHKEVAAGRCLSLDPSASDAGAVNMVRFEGPAWAGWNTDGPALDRLLTARLDADGLRAVVVGAGGTGRTAARVLQRRGARVTVVNRTTERARRVGDALGVEWAPWDELDRLAVDVLVFAIPAGPGRSPRGSAGARGQRLVVDFAYVSGATPEIEAARAAGIPAIDGLDLLAAQGADQFAIMTGAVADEADMRRTAVAWLARRGGLAAPGSGAA